MTKKIMSIVAVLLLVTALFSGCTKEQVLKAFSIDIDTYDPATEMVTDVMNKTIQSENLQSGDYKYNLFTDDTAAITGYTGNNAVLNIPETLDGHTVVALENKALYKLEVITELVLPDTVEVVGNFAAMYCENLEKVTFGKNIKNIGVSAFESEGDETKSLGGGKLTTIVFNGSPEMIREKAFYYADKLTEIVLPENVKTIENWAFAKCFKADKIVIGEGNEIIGDHAFLKCRAAKSITIPDSCKTISTSAFYQCLSATDLSIGNGVEEMQKGAFEECSSLEKVVLPESLKTMAPYIFYNCTSLKECVAGDKIEFIDKDVFTGDKEVVVNAPSGSVMAEYAEANKVSLAK